VFISTVVLGAISFVAFVLERLALTDIIHGEPNTALEWTVVNAALIPVATFHVLGVVSAIIGLRLEGRRKTLDTAA
jgi:hypothetical protein